MLACRTPFSLWIWLKRGTGKASTEQTRRSGKSISGKNREKTGNGITDSASDYVRFYSHFSFLRSLLLVPLFTVFRYDTKKMRSGPPVHTWTTVNGLQIWNLKEFIFCFSTPSWAVHRAFIFSSEILERAYEDKNLRNLINRKRELPPKDFKWRHLNSDFNIRKRVLNYNHGHNLLKHFKKTRYTRSCRRCWCHGLREQLPPNSVGRLSVDFRPTVHRLSTDRRPTALRKSTDQLKLTLSPHHQQNRNQE